MLEFVVGALTSKTRLAALGMAVSVFLQLSGVHVPPVVQHLLEALGFWGARDAMAKLQKALPKPPE